MELTMRTISASMSGLCVALIALSLFGCASPPDPSSAKGLVQSAEKSDEMAGEWATLPEELRSAGGIYGRSYLAAITNEAGAIEEYCGVIVGEGDESVFYRVASAGVTRDQLAIVHEAEPEQKIGMYWDNAGRFLRFGSNR
jgi:hypothetical protein